MNIHQQPQQPPSYPPRYQPAALRTQPSGFRFRVCAPLAQIFDSPQAQHHLQTLQQNHDLSLKVAIDIQAPNAELSHACSFISEIMVAAMNLWLTPEVMEGMVQFAANFANNNHANQHPLGYNFSPQGAATEFTHIIRGCLTDRSSWAHIVFDWTPVRSVVDRGGEIVSDQDESNEGIWALHETELRLPAPVSSSQLLTLFTYTSFRLKTLTENFHR